MVSYFWSKIIAMTIERTSQNIIIKLPADMNIEDLQRMMDYFLYKEIGMKSRARQEDIDALARQSSRTWWQDNKQRFLPES